MKVLVACEESQRVCTAFRERGHEAYSCDIQDCSGGHPEWHIKCDVLKILNPKKIEDVDGDCFGIEFCTVDENYHFIDGKWDLIIAHPPCTYFSTAGANWLFRGGKINQERLEKGIIMKDFFMQIYNSTADKICIENPTPIKLFHLPPHTQVIQPYFFGDSYKKRTLLWLKNLPLLNQTNLVNPVAKWVSCGNSKNRIAQNNAICKSHKHGKDRAKTFPGIAKAMAEQWG